MYSNTGRPSIPPERLLKAQLLIALYSVRSDRMFCEQLNYNILFRWFLDMNHEEPSFDATSFTKNRERLLVHDVSLKFFDAVVRQARKQDLLSDDHFTVDGTLIEAWASMKSFQSTENQKDSNKPQKDGGRNGDSDFQGYHASDFVSALRDRNIVPHIAQAINRKTPGLNRRTTRHAGYAISQRIRKRVEEIFGWFQTVEQRDQRSRPRVLSGTNELKKQKILRVGRLGLPVFLSKDPDFCEIISFSATC